MALKVAIVGLAEDCRHGIPWDDPEWELWGMPWDAEGWPRFHRTFEIHDDADLKATYKPLAKYFERLKQCSRLYMDEAFPEVPNAVRYPFEAVAADVGDYWNSSIGYMLSLAIHEGAEEIAVYGIKMEARDEWGYQRPNCEYLIGFARGRGIKVHIPENSPLCKFIQVPGWAYAGRYGKNA
jgi:hypothetical protein